MNLNRFSNTQTIAFDPKFLNFIQIKRQAAQHDSDDIDKSQQSIKEDKISQSISDNITQLISVKTATGGEINHKNFLKTVFLSTVALISFFSSSDELPYSTKSASMLGCMNSRIKCFHFQKKLQIYI